MNLAFTVLMCCAVVGQAVSSTKEVSRSLSGTWVLDPTRGVLSDARPRDITLVLIDDGETVTVTERIAGKKDDRFSCKSDGTPCEQTTTGSVYTRLLRRESRELAWQIDMTRRSDNASIKWTERWSLSDDGRTLTLHRSFPRNREFLEVFRRAGS